MGARLKWLRRASSSSKAHRSDQSRMANQRLHGWYLLYLCLTLLITQNHCNMTSPLAQADALVSTDPTQAETLYKQILSTKAGEFRSSSVSRACLTDMSR